MILPDRENPDVDRPAKVGPPHPKCSWHKLPHAKHYVANAHEFCPGRAHETFTNCQRKYDHDPHIWTDGTVFYTCNPRSILSTDPLVAALEYSRAEAAVLHEENTRLKAELSSAQNQLAAARARPHPLAHRA